MNSTVHPTSRLSLTLKAVLYAFFFAMIVALPYLALGIDSGHLLTIFVIGPLVTLYLLGAVFISWSTDSHRPQLYTFFLYCILTALFFIEADYLRDLVQWASHRSELRAKVLAQPAQPCGFLQHANSDGSGFAGIAVNLIYVVYDPSDGLASAANSGQHGKYKGLPCDVLRVYRLERHWYSAHFYTDSSWDACSF